MWDFSGSSFAHKPREARRTSTASFISSKPASLSDSQATLRREPTLDTQPDLEHTQSPGDGIVSVDAKEIHTITLRRCHGVDFRFVA